ncbi:sensor histidine kinase [Trichlorobacter ammonificans]|uniref:histidine kinase n=1 Tax=Trichlorobacter ammonificans TaxID=2916410 RepID=A0ABM9D671_9BACT|nr:ATP-binding protein [Trichlorobacter ammonificans]CAH2030694.1 Two-component sensor PilS [Trichlorobacter ammonificans]
MPAWRPSLTFCILTSLAGLLLLTWFLFSLFALKTAENDLYAQKSEHGRMLLSTFVNQLPDRLPTFPEGMLPLDAPAALYAAKLAEERSLVRLTLLDSGGKVIYTVGKEGSDLYQPLLLPGRQAEEAGMLPDGNALVRSALVLREGQVAGRAGLMLSLADEQQRLSRTRRLFASYFVLDFILLLGLGAFILSRIVVNPVNRLLAATERIIGGVYGHRVALSGTSELARLAASFNEMSAALLQKQQEVSSHVAALEQANRELELAREEAVRAEKMASVGLLAAGTAHEIGSPLASIMGYAEILAAEAAPDSPQADYHRRILDGCDRIDRIVRGLLEYARPRSPACEEIDAGELAGRTVELLQHQGMFKQCRVDVRHGASLPRIFLDPHQVQQVLINLLINAHDAMPEGGTLRVSVESAALGQGVRIEVADSGAGIPPQLLERIFDPFFTTKEPGRGTGLGLAISTGIAQGLGGRITVRSQPGNGSCFTLWLPERGTGCREATGE